MRVIAGKLGGRTFNSPRGHRTHPMSDKVRGALFNSLGDIAGLTVLDAFAGSGGLAFEAISRGAKSVVAIDHDKRAAQTIRDNIRELGLANEIKAVQANSSGWSDNNSGELFDLVILAPPYDDLQSSLLDKLTRHVKPRGLLVLDWPGDVDAPDFTGFQEISAKNYGDAALYFYRCPD